MSEPFLERALDVVVGLFEDAEAAWATACPKDAYEDAPSLVTVVVAWARDTETQARLEAIASAALAAAFGERAETISVRVAPAAIDGKDKHKSRAEMPWEVRSF